MDRDVSDKILEVPSPRSCLVFFFIAIVVLCCNVMNNVHKCG